MTDIYGTNQGETIDEAAAGGVSGQGSRIYAQGGSDLIIGLRKAPFAGSNPAEIIDQVDGGGGTDVYRVTLDNAWTATTSQIHETFPGGGQWTVNLVRVEALDLTVMTHGTATLGDGNDRIDVQAGPSGSGHYATGGGDDLVVLRRGTASADLGAGDDRLVIDHSYDNARTYLTTPFSGDLASGYSGTYRRSDGASSSANLTFAGVEHFTITTGGGADTITTGDGDDVLATGAGADVIVVGKGDDAVDGGSEVDTLGIDLSDETTGITIDLTAAGAQQTGGSGSVANIESFQGAVVGSAFDDVFVEGVYGYDANFSTGAGDDRVQVSRGSDTVDLGAGDDRLVLAHGYNDTAWTRLTTALSGDIKSGYSGTYYRSDGASPSATVTFSGVEHFTITTGGGADAITTGDGDDVVSTGAGADVIAVGKGDDVVDGGAGVDTLSIDLSDERSGVSLDLLAIGAQQTGGSGSVTGVESFQGAVIGTAFDDVFVEGAYAYDASFSTGRGDDLVQVARGTDTVNMGAGDDRLVLDHSYNTARTYLSVALSGDLASGYSGTYYRSDGASASAKVAFTGVESFTITTGGGNDILDTGGGRDVLKGGGGNDALSAAGGRDALEGGDGADTLDGGAGADTMTGGLGNDVFVVDAAGDRVVEGADAGVDTVRSSVTLTLGVNLENLVLTGASAIDGAGNRAANSLTGNEAANTLFGDKGNDTLTGAAGDDVLDGGKGADSMAGGAGGDTYVVDNAGDVVTDSAGVDTVRSAIGYTLGANIENLVLTGAARAGTGNTLANRIDGSIGDDHLSGLDGADSLYGGKGADTVEGGAGADLLVGGVGQDLLTGGAAADRFRFETGDLGSKASLADRISDFSHAEGDLIDLSGFDAIAGAPAGDHFSFIGEAAFSGAAGELRYLLSGADTLVTGDTDGDGKGDVALILAGHVALVDGDFVL